MTPYRVRLVNPKTSEERSIIVMADSAAAEAALCPESYFQAIARPDIPDGFMLIANGMRPVTQ